MGVQLPDINALGRRPVPRGQRGFAQQDTAAAGAALSGVGQTIQRDVGGAYELIQKEDDANAVFAARRKLDEWERAAIYDPEKGAITKTGKDAFGLPDAMAQSFDKTAGQISEGLTTERQRKAFNDLALSRRTQVLDWTSRHETQQRESYQATEFKADLASMQERAALLATTPNDGTPEGVAAQASRVRGEIDVGQSRIVGFMRGKGMPAESIAMAVKDFSSKTHSAAVGALIAANDTAGAQAYLKANEGAMELGDVQRLKSGMQEAVTRGKAQAFGDEADKAGWTLAQSLEQARSRFTGHDETAAVSEVKTRYAEREAMKAQAAKQVSTDAWSVLMERGTMSAIPAQQMALLRKTAPEEERQMRDWLEAKWRRAKADAEGAKSENWGAFMALADLANDDPEKFLDPQTLLRAEPNLSKGQMSALVSMRTSMNKGDLKAQNVLKVSRDVEANIMADLKAAGIDTTPKDGDKKAAETLQQFRGELRMALDAAQQEKGRALNPQEAQAVGLSMVRVGIEQGSGIFGFFQTKKRGYEIASEQRAGEAKTYVSKRYSDIPPAIREELQKSLPKTIYGVVDEAQVERMYQRGVEQGRFK